MAATCCTAKDIKEFMAKAKPNDRYIYFVGMSVQDGILSKEIGKLTYEMAKKGEIYLAMKRSYNYLSSFDHYLIKASTPPVHSLIPFTDEKVEMKLKLKYKGARTNGKDQRASEEQRERERDNSVR